MEDDEGVPGSAMVEDDRSEELMNSEMLNIDASLVEVEDEVAIGEDEELVDDEVGMGELDEASPRARRLAAAGSKVPVICVNIQLCSGSE
jgi:hypothetical protein